MRLYICEKPSQGPAYAAALGITAQRRGSVIDGGDEVITWCVGHLLTPLAPADYDEKYKKWKMEDLPILPKENWKVKVSPDKITNARDIKALLEKADEVVIASDPDREGEMIVVSLLERFNYKGKRTRVWTSALNKTSLKKAIDNKKDASETYNEYLSARTRLKSDWVAGMNLSRAMTVANQGKIEGAFSLGRVQTPTLNLIVKRDLEIENFQPLSHYTAACQFDLDNSFLDTEYVLPSGFIDEETGKCIDEEKIKAMAAKVKGKNGIVTKSEKIRKKEAAPLLYSLSALQQACSEKFGLTANDTLAVAQSLYETHKATSYPRSDCLYVNVDQIKEIPIVFKAMLDSDPKNTVLKDMLDNADTTKKTKVWNDKKVEASAHHAIIPTVDKFDITKLNDLELKVYELIKHSYIAQFYPECETDNTKIEITCEDEIFKATGNMPVIDGWKTIVGKKSKTKELPSLEEGSEVFNAKPKSETKKTTPPKRYTDGTLIDAMMNAAKFVTDPDYKKLLKGTEGIGTEATRGGIIERIEKIGYFKRVKKDIISTEKGRSLIKYAPEKSKSIEETAYLESRLELIRKGELTESDYLEYQENNILKMLEDIRAGKHTIPKSIASVYDCPVCNSGLRKIKTKDNKKIWLCTSPNTVCNAIFNDNRGKPLIIDQGKVKHTCEVCKKGTLLRKKSQKGTMYFQCQEAECKQIYTEDEGMIPKLYVKEVVEQSATKFTCFKCEKGELERKKGQYGYYHKCKECGTNFKEGDDLAPIKPKPKPKSEHKCPNCKEGYLVIRNGAKGAFFGCNNYPKCKTTQQEKDGKPVPDEKK